MSEVDGGEEREIGGGERERVIEKRSEIGERFGRRKGERKGGSWRGNRKDP